MISKKFKLSTIEFYSVIIALALGLPNMAFAATIQLPQTGQTKCYDTAGNEITCTGTGQDGDIQYTVAWPNPRFTVNSDTTIIDSLTGIIWAANGNLMQSRDPSFDNDVTAGDGRVTWQHALDYVEKLNNEKYLGYNDWRLPNINELESLINAGKANSASWLNSQGFTNAQSWYYWSSTTAAYYPPGAAWVVYLFTGVVDSIGRFYSVDYYAWPVRGGQSVYPDATFPANIWKTGQTTNYYGRDDGALKMGVTWPNQRFNDHSDGTVTDNLTGLIWTKNANPAGISMSWQQALDYVKILNIGGHTDWRLPNRKELISLIDYSQYDPALPLGHPFTNVHPLNCWSATSTPDGFTVAYFVNMDLGIVFHDVKGSSKNQFKNRYTS